MESVEPKSYSWLWDSHISPENCKWLAENLEGVDQSVKQMLKLIEEDGNSDAIKVGLYYQKRPQLIAHVDEFCRLHKLLAERYDHLTGELHRNFPTLLKVQRVGISDPGSHQACPLLTPDNKLGLQKSEQVGGFDLFLSSGGGSSDSSPKEGSESSSSLSSDSDSESFNSSINKRSVPSVGGDGKGLHQKFVELETEFAGIEEKVQLTKQENVDGTLKVRETGDYEVLHSRLMDYEQELRVSNKKLQFSEEEIARLQAQLESAQSDIKMSEANLEKEKKKVLELQNQVAVLETQIFDSGCEIGILGEELKMTSEKLWGSEEEISKLKHELSNKNFEGTHQLQCQLELTQKDVALLETMLDWEKSQVLELREKISYYVADVSDRDHEISRLNAALYDEQEKFSREKAQLQSDISGLLDQQTLLMARIGEWELQTKQCQAENLEMKRLAEAQEIRWQADIDHLKAETKEKCELIETLNKNLDMLKLKYDMLMAEKDGINAKVDSLNAEVCHCDNQIRQMEDHQHQLQLEYEELVAGSESARKLTGELRLRVEELEKEVDSQRAVISDRAEEKREAIRQLCFSLEHYRTGYKELRQAFIGHKRHAVLAS